MGYTHSAMIRTLYILICTVLLLAAGCRASSDTALAPTAAADNPPTLDPQQVARGAEIYALNCAECHGANLEGEAGWKLQNPDGSFRAPPHDASGHTWHHPDDVLFRIVREGTAAVVGGGYESDMPGFADVLSDADIRAVLDYIKSTWPERERRYQERVSEAN